MRALRFPQVLVVKLIEGLLLATLVLPLCLRADANQPLTNDNILTLLQWKARPQEIVSLIERNATQFDLSPENLAKLRSAGAKPAVLEAMWKATLRASVRPRAVSAADAAAVVERPPKRDQSNSTNVPAPEMGAEESSAGANQAAASKTDPPPPEEAQESATPPHSQDRLDKARSIVADPADKDYPNLPRLDENCPLSESQQEARYNADLDWKSGSGSPSRVDHSGNYCFQLRNANNVLYTYGFTLSRLEPQGSDFDLLKDAMAKAKGFLAGQVPAPDKVAGPSTMLLRRCSFDFREVGAKSKAFENALAQLDPAKDSSGNPTSVSLDTTLAKWDGLSDKFNEFEGAIRGLIRDLGKAGQPGPANCDLENLQNAEALVLDVYVPARDSYLELKRRKESQHIARFTAELEETDGYDVVVKEYAGGKPTTADAKTFHLDPGRKILTSSVGFLLTQLQARSYSSRTAPDPNNPALTQNVLGIDGSSGTRPAITALLNYNLPKLPWRNTGLAVSAGPVFDISSGKADTSRIGFFGGLSFHVWNRLFLTPGVHVGEFADFPQGFTHAGQIIPAGTGTPNPVKRYTARFAFAITFKVSELGFGKGNNSNETPPKTPPSSQPKPPPK